MKFEIPVEVSDSKVDTKSGISKAGKPYQIREQHAYINLGRTYPVEFRFALEMDHEPYAPGKYVVDPSCLYVDRYGQLSLGRVRLIGA